MYICKQVNIRLGKYIMNDRNNKVFELAAKKGAELSREKHLALAYKTMEKAGLPYTIIERVLFEPHNIRKTD